MLILNLNFYKKKLNMNIRRKIEELYLNIDHTWTDQEVIEYIESILPFVPDEDLEENLEILNDLKSEIRNKKIEIILKKVKKNEKGH